MLQWTQIILFVLVTGSSASAITRSQFPIGGQRAIIMVSARSVDGSTDSDAATLYDRMNVPPQNSFIGPGKAIVTSNKDMNFVCAIRQGVGNECSLIFQGSSRSQVMPSKKQVRYELLGEEAQQMADLWVRPEGHFEFISIDNKIHLFVSPERFLFEYNEI